MSAHWRWRELGEGGWWEKECEAMAGAMMWRLLAAGRFGVFSRGFSRVFDYSHLAWTSSSLPDTRLRSQLYFVSVPLSVSSALIQAHDIVRPRPRRRVRDNCPHLLSITHRPSDSQMAQR